MDRCSIKKTQQSEYGKAPGRRENVCVKMETRIYVDSYLGVPLRSSGRIKVEVSAVKDKRGLDFKFFCLSLCSGCP